MAKRKARVMLTLEQQLEAMPPRPQLDVLEPWMDRTNSLAQIEWDRKRAQLIGAIKHRDAKRIADPGRDAAGNFDVSSFAKRAHKVETAPKDLGPELPKDSQFPKRIATQRMIDRYRVHGHITPTQWVAADALWRLWCIAGLEASVVSRYSGMSGKGSSYTAPFEGRADAAARYLAAMGAVPYRCRGCVIHVVVTDWSASDWARGRGLRGRDSEAHGMERLRAGLSALAAHFGY